MPSPSVISPPASRAMCPNGDIRTKRYITCKQAEKHVKIGVTKVTRDAILSRRLCGILSSIAMSRMRDKTNRGYTIIELMVVVAVIAVLASVSTMFDSPFLTMSTDTEKTSDVTTISHRLEAYYRLNAAGGDPSYPTRTEMSANANTIVGSDDALTAPGSSTVSLVNASTAITPQAPTNLEYIYQPFNDSNSICDAAPCVRYTLYYRLQASDTVVTIHSLRQQ